MSQYKKKKNDELYKANGRGYELEEIVLKNGSRGLLLDIADASVMHLSFQFRAGHEFISDTTLYELPHILEHMMFGANAQFGSMVEYEKEFIKNGAYHNAFTSQYSIVYEAQCADFEWKRILDLHLHSLSQPHFNEKELEAEKGNVRNELISRLNNHMTDLVIGIDRELGRKVKTIKDRISTIANIELRDIKDYYKKTHTTDNLRFIVAGKITPNRRIAIIERLEKIPLSRGERLTFPLLESHRIPVPLVTIKKEEFSNLFFSIVFSLSREVTLEEEEVLEGLRQFLMGGFSSRIFGEARRRGLAYHLDSFTLIKNGSTDLYFYGETTHETAEELIILIKSILGSLLRDGFTLQEIEDVKTYLMGRFCMSNQTVASKVALLADRYYWDDTIVDFEGYGERLEQFTETKFLSLLTEFVRQGNTVMGIINSGDYKQAEMLSQLFYE